MRFRQHSRVIVRIARRDDVVVQRLERCHRLALLVGDAQLVTGDAVVLHDERMAEQRRPVHLFDERLGELLEGVGQNNYLYEIIAWFGLVAPAKLPEAVVQRLNDANMKGMAGADFKQKFATIGADVVPMGPAEFGKFIQAEVVHWAKLVQLAGIQPE